MTATAATVDKETWQPSPIKARLPSDTRASPDTEYAYGFYWVEANWEADHIKSVCQVEPGYANPQRYFDEVDMPRFWHWECYHVNSSS